MSIGRLYRTFAAIFFIGILSSTFFMQGMGVRKKLSIRSAGYSLVANSPDTPSKATKQSPVGSGLVNEEEEEEEIHMKAEFVEIHNANGHILVRPLFSSPTLFFKELIQEVTSPPPWA